MDEQTLRKLRSKLDKALAANQHDEAVRLLTQLSAADSSNARWPHRQGDLLRKLERYRDAASAYASAADIYAAQGFLSRAVAVAKTVANLDPRRLDVLERIDPDAAKQFKRNLRPPTQPFPQAPARADERTNARVTMQGFANGPRAPSVAGKAGAQPTHNAKGGPVQGPGVNRVTQPTMPAVTQQSMVPARKHPMVLNDDEPVPAPVPPVSRRQQQAVMHQARTRPDTTPSIAAPQRLTMPGRRHPMVLDDDAPVPTPTVAPRPQQAAPNQTRARVEAPVARAESAPTRAPQAARPEAAPGRMPPGARPDASVTYVSPAARPDALSPRTAPGSQTGAAAPRTSSAARAEVSAPRASSASQAESPPRAPGIARPEAPQARVSNRPPSRSEVLPTRASNPPPAEDDDIIIVVLEDEDLEPANDVAPAAEAPAAAPAPAAAATEAPPQPTAAPKPAKPKVSLDKLSVPPPRPAPVRQSASSAAPRSPSAASPSPVPPRPARAFELAPPPALGDSESLELPTGKFPPMRSVPSVPPARPQVASKRQTLRPGAVTVPRPPSRPLTPEAVASGQQQVGSPADARPLANEVKPGASAAGVSRASEVADARSRAREGNSEVGAWPQRIVEVADPRSLSREDNPEDGAAWPQQVDAVVDPRLLATEGKPDAGAAEARRSGAVVNLHSLALEGAAAVGAPGQPQAAAPAPRSSDPDVYASAAEEFSRALEAAAPASIRPQTAAELEAARCLDALLRLPQFAKLDAETLGEIAADSTLVELGAGANVMQRGQPSDALYGILSGSATLFGPESSYELNLVEGELFGEACVLNNEPCQGDVFVAGQLEALKIPRATLTRVLKRKPRVADQLLGLLTTRLRFALESSPLFRELDPHSRQELSARFEVRRASKGRRLAEQDVPLDGLYISLTGRLTVERSGFVSRVAPAFSLFGHQLLMASKRSPATVTANSNLLLLRLPAAAFGEVALTFPRFAARLARLVSSDVVPLD